MKILIFFQGHRYQKQCLYEQILVVALQSIQARGCHLLAFHSKMKNSFFPFALEIEIKKKNPQNTV